MRNFFSISILLSYFYFIIVYIYRYLNKATFQYIFNLLYSLLKILLIVIISLIIFSNYIVNELTVRIYWRELRLIFHPKSEETITACDKHKVMYLDILMMFCYYSLIIIIIPYYVYPYIYISLVIIILIRGNLKFGRHYFDKNITIRNK